MSKVIAAVFCAAVVGAGLGSASAEHQTVEFVIHRTITLWNGTSASVCAVEAPRCQRLLHVEPPHH
jgi:hypothetical protein